ncbi:MAG: MBL fold metallo-hydrolase [Pseudomonadales bacterium]
MPSRRALLLTATATIALAACATTVVEARDGARFSNPHIEARSGGFFAYLRMRLFGDDVWASYDPVRDGPVPVATPAAVSDGTVTVNATVTWIGHSTVLVQHRGVNVLTDPMLSDYASPLPFAGPRRQSAPALEADQLPAIDVVVISHDHYDHLDVKTIRALGNRPHYYVPLGLASWMVRQGIDRDRVTEMGWWDRTTLDLAHASVEITATPSQHFSGRSLTDRNRTLWASWAIRWQDFSLWFGGDTGYNPVQFKEIGQRFGGFDLGIVPIGAYRPRDFMAPVHVDPSEAVLIHRDIGAHRSLGVHWGTFILTAEPLLEPPVALARAAAEAGLAPETFTTFAVGETRSFTPQTAM